MAESIAEEYYAKFTGDDAAAVLSSLADPARQKTFEDNWLDFKSGKPANDDNLREIWSKAIGAMANAGGGVIVWGLIARKHGKPPVDAVEREELVEDVDAFYSKLTEAEHFATDPPLHGIRKKAVRKNPGSKEGYVVALVPEGTTKAYESLKGAKPYYIRIGDSSKPVPRSILQQLFNPQYNPRIQIEVEPNLPTPGNSAVETHWNYQPDTKWLRVTLRNIGASTLQRCCLRIESDSIRLGEWENNTDQVQTAAEALIQLAPYIHPRMKTARVFITFLKNQGTHRVSFTLYAQNMIPKTAEVEFIGHRTQEKTVEFE